MNLVKQSNIYEFGHTPVVIFFSVLFIIFALLTHNALYAPVATFITITLYFIIIIIGNCIV